MSVRGFSKSSGISESVLRRYLSGDSDPGMKALIAIARVSNVNVLWLATGEGPMRPGDAALDGEFALVPRYNVEASAGGGAEISSEQVVDHLAFKRSWIAALDLQHDRLALISAKGDSMEPTIKDGDLLLVDTRPVESLAEGIYILRVDGLLLAKRLQCGLDGGVIVRSDNPIYPELRADRDQIDRLKIVGRVVWTGSKV